MQNKATIILLIFAIVQSCSDFEAPKPIKVEQPKSVNTELKTDEPWTLGIEQRNKDSIFMEYIDPDNKKKSITLNILDSIKIRNAIQKVKELAGKNVKLKVIIKQNKNLTFENFEKIIADLRTNELYKFSLL